MGKSKCVIIYVAIVFLLSSTHSYAGNTLIFGQSFDPIADISARVLKEAYKRINIEVEFKKMLKEGRISEIRKEFVKRLVKSDLKIEQSAPAE